MAIDEVKLQKAIDDLGVKIRTDSEALGKLETVRSCLNYVLTEDRIDERTSKKITTTTRQKIYDDNIALAATLLA